MKSISRITKAHCKGFSAAIVVLLMSAFMTATPFGDAEAGQATLSLTAPTAYSDGTPFTTFSQFKIYYGTTPGNYTQNVAVGKGPTYTVGSLTEGATYYFAATSMDSTGNESGYSNEVSKYIPPIQQYSLTVTKTGTGSGTVTGTGINCGPVCTAPLAPGSVQMLTAVADSGSIFSSWGGACSGTGPCTVTMNGSASVTASFSKVYTLTATSGGGGSITTVGPGAVSMVSSGGTTIQSITIPQAASQSFTITPASGYRIAAVKVDGVSIGAVSSYFFTNINANHTIEASFSAGSYAVTASAGSGGTISPSGTSYLASGARQTYTISPFPGYVVSNVKVDNVSVGQPASYTFSNISGNHSISATFAVKNLLANGTFETGTLSGWINNGGITVSSAARYSGSYGAHMASSGRIDQIFQTVVGKTYYVTGRIRINQQVAPYTWGGVVAQINNSNWKQLGRSQYINPGNSPIGSWAKVSFSFVATTSQTRLVYQNFSNGKFSASADVFAVTEIPIQ